MNKPNILWVFADQHRFCDLGCYGNPQVETPHLDAFARQGVVMENFYSTVRSVYRRAAPCSPGTAPAARCGEQRPSHLPGPGEHRRRAQPRRL